MIMLSLLSMVGLFAGAEGQDFDLIWDDNFCFLDGAYEIDKDDGDYELDEKGDKECFPVCMASKTNV